MQNVVLLKSILVLIVIAEFQFISEYADIDSFVVNYNHILNSV